MRIPRLRTLLLLLLVAAGVANVHALVLNVRAHARLRDAAFDAVRARVTGVRAVLGQRVALGGGYDREAALRQAFADGHWEAVEAFSAEGRLLASTPAPSPVRHWVNAVEMETLRAGAVLVGPEPRRRSGRVLAYALFSGPDGQTVLRFSAIAAELAEDRDERGQAVLGHAVTLIVLLLAAGLVLAPRTGGAEPAPARALVAYEEAMERLRDHGEEQTERHAAERQKLEEVLRDKEALARAGELTAGIVHEVRNGLGTIVGYARLAEKSPAEAQESARRIREECETLESIIRRFMDFVRSENLSLGPVDVAGMLQRVVARECRREGSTVSIAAAGAGGITADEALLERAFENLVRNAREAAGPSGRVWVTAERQRDSVLVTVSDDGQGLAPAVRATLRPFFTTKAGGLGLGLAIALKIVRLHGGQLVFGDRAPRGAAVSVRLPVSPAPGDPIVTKGSDAGEGGGTRPRP